MATQSHFYFTLLSNALREIYEQNTHADFAVKQAQPVDLGSTSNWKARFCEVPCSSLPIDDSLTIIYCNLTTPYFLGDTTVRSNRTFVFPSSSCRYEFQNVYYVPLKQRKFQAIRIEFLTTEVLHIPFEDSTTPTKLVLHFQKNYKW